jgi:beta-glucosidase
VSNTADAQVDAQDGAAGTRDFPVDFLWGAATAAHQVEGANLNSDWWAFEHNPSTAARESSGDAIDQFHRYAEDFTLLKSLGHNAHRLSIEWSRIEPAPGEFSQNALAHYRRVLTALAESGMTPMVTLHHFTLPQWFAEQGGWLAPNAISLFERYCTRVIAELGDLMPFVCTINEPQMIALHGYLEGYHPPGVTNAILWKRVGRVLLEAHKAAVRIVHDGAKGSQAGLVVQLPLLAPARDDATARAFCDAMRSEIVDLYIDNLAGDDSGDWLGLQYYRKQWVDPSLPTMFADAPAGTQLTQMGWAVYPDGLREMLHRAADAGLPLHVTENGIATEDDAERVDYLESHLRAVAQARDEGLDIRGYIHWSAFDNFEWSEGFRPKFGLIAVDRGNDFARSPKPSAYAFARVAASGRIASLRESASD